MNDNLPHFIVTKEHRRFVEFCDACRRYQYIGLCYGTPGVGKTLSARTYARWDEIGHLYDLRGGPVPPTPNILKCRRAFYTAPVASTVGRLEKEVRDTRFMLSCVVEDMEYEVHGIEHNVFRRQDYMHLLIVDEVDRLKTAGLELMRDVYDRGQMGLVLVGMPGIEKRLSRYPQLYSRVGFVHHFKPISTDEMNFILQHKWEQLGLRLDRGDFTDEEAVAAVIRTTGGNFRLLQRLFAQIERILEINELQTITKEVVETARESLIIGVA